MKQHVCVSGSDVKAVQKELATKHGRILGQLHEAEKSNRILICKALSELKHDCIEAKVPFKSTFKLISKDYGIKENSIIYSMAKLEDSINPLLEKIYRRKDFTVEEFEAYQESNSSALIAIADIGGSNIDIRKTLLIDAVKNNMTNRVVKDEIKKRKSEKTRKSFDGRPAKVLSHDDGFKLFHVKDASALPNYNEHEVKEWVVDVVISSPDYGCGLNYPTFNDNAIYEEYEKRHLLKLQRLYKRLKPGGTIIYIVPSGQMFDDDFLGRDMDGHILFKRLLEEAGFRFWDKKFLHNMGGAYSTKGSSDRPVSNHSIEYALVYSKGERCGKPADALSKSNDYYAKTTKPDMWESSDGDVDEIIKSRPRPNSKIFPRNIFRCPFSDELSVRLINSYTYEGETILDPHAGSCVLGLHSINMGRRYIGYETDECQFNFIQKNLSKMAEEIRKFHTGGAK